MGTRTRRRMSAQWVLFRIMALPSFFSPGVVVSAWTTLYPGTTMEIFASRSTTRTTGRSTISRLILLAGASNRKGEIDKAKADTRSDDKPLVVDICNNPYYERFVSFLEAEIGLTDPDEAKKIAEKSQGILSLTEPALKKRFDLFRDLFNYSNDDLQKIMLRRASALCWTSMTLRTKINELSHILLLENDLEAVGVILLKQPTLLTMDVKKNMKPKVVYLRERVFQDDNNAMIIALINNPVVLTISLDNRIIPRTEALLAAGVNPSTQIRMSYICTDADFQTWFEKKTSTSFPDDWSPREQSTLSPQERYQERIELLSTKLGMTTEEATHVIEKWPNIKRSNLENLSAKIDGIVGIYFGSKHYASQAIQTLPQLVTYSTQMNLQPKVEYLREYAFSRDTAALMDTITKCPSILGYSLENRIKPRLDAVQTAGLSLKDIDVAGAITKPEHKFVIWLENKANQIRPS